MKSLYTKFILVGVTFISFSVTLQILWWKRGRVLVTKLDELLAKGYFDKQSRPTDTLQSSSATTKSTWVNISDSRFIWNTASGFDRIPEQMKHVPENIQHGDNRTRIILVSNGPGSFGVREGTETFRSHNCPVQNCKLIGPNGREKVLDAVLFGQDVASITAMRRKRHKDEVWIFFALESPMATGMYSYVENLVNWTATYRRDSTMVAPYERWYKFANASLIKQTRNYAKGKTKMAAMFVSNCGASNDRLRYAKELQKYVEVDIYGFCGSKQCPRTDAEKCFQMLNKDYKFYLAFENANCRDYITEKFFVNGLGHDVIPIVMGAHPEDYKKSAPEHSFIHVEHFQSPKELADYMKVLDKNETLYNEYFKWKGTGKFINTKFWCRLCALVSDNSKPRLIVENLDTWWRGGDTCINGKWLH